LEKYLVTVTKAAERDLMMLKDDNLNRKARELIKILENNPFRTPSPFKKLHGQASNMYSRRLNSKNRLVYEVRESPDREYAGIVNIVRMRTHYRFSRLLVLV
jgi:Txe/YoeB family toxin of toxin-antitoxin system